MLMLLLAVTDAITKKRCCKRYAIRFFYSSGDKIIFILLTKVIADYMVNISINVSKACFEGTFTRAICSCESSFYYYLNNILHFLIQINSWQSFETSKSYYQYVERPWEYRQYVRKPQRQGLSAGKLVQISKRQRQTKQNGAVEFKNMTLNPTRAFVGSQSHKG